MFKSVLQFYTHHFRRSVLIFSSFLIENTSNKQCIKSDKYISVLTYVRVIAYVCESENLCT